MVNTRLVGVSKLLPAALVHALLSHGQYIRMSDRRQSETVQSKQKDLPPSCCLVVGDAGHPRRSAALGGTRPSFVEASGVVQHNDDTNQPDNTVAPYPRQTTHPPPTPTSYVLRIPQNAPNPIPRTESPPNPLHARQLRALRHSQAHAPTGPAAQTLPVHRGRHHGAGAEELAGRVRV